MESNNVHNAEFESDFDKQIAPISALAQLDHNQVAKTISNSIKEGNVEPLKVHMFLKRVEKIIEILKEDKEVKDILMNEAGKHVIDGKSFDYMGATLRVGPTYTFTDYSTCGDPLWDSFDEAEKTVKAMKKEREAFLKAAFPETTSLFGSPNPTVIVDYVYSLTQSDLGEEVTLMKPQKKQTMGVVTTFKKAK